MQIEHYLVAAIKTWDGMTPDERRNPAGLALRNEVKAIGMTAAFFGDYDAMKRLHDAAEDLVGNDNSVGYWLNTMWDQIGDWCS
jgi:hypothetical protein